MSARLLVYSGKLRGKVFSLPPEGKIIIGRSQQATLPLPDVNLSRGHCSIAATGQGYVLSDLNSTNGTFLNGKQIKQVLLRETDKITIGETDLEFRVRDQFDDTETKMDLLPVGTPEEISPEEAIQMMQATSEGKGRPEETGGVSAASVAAMISTPHDVFSRLTFCGVCDVTIPRGDAASGAAREIESRMLCAECIGRLQGKNIDAAASLAHVLDELRAEVLRSRG